MEHIDYKEKYEQALKRARQFSEKPYLEDSAGIVEYIFPELKESEDERIRKQTLKVLNYYKDEEKSEGRMPIEIEECIAWIEKLEIKEHVVCDTCDEKASCVNPCPMKLIEQKLVMSEEDKRIIDNLISQLGNLFSRKLIKKSTKDKYVNWLKSLRPQSQWKPSDEQIEALDFAIDCIVWREFCFKRKVLNGLLEQLKKLREE